ncbi:cerebral cavernous malformations 2 protein-like [Saccoglossus kowalevskii]|uniref:Malcavernin-like n=1 Tax=Saccoglossus kowalevskii TaxID=10224 RepID=A0ABM0GSY8_SACKO|nr:PREDICTED: malcavernin-like [Saccoglossus kowalevskii]
MGDDAMSRDSSRRQSGGLISRVFNQRSSDKDRDRKMPLKEGRPIRERRRLLKSYEVIGPDYKVDAQVLIDSYIEKEVKYLGQVPNIPGGLDPTKRTEILRVLDAGKRHGDLPWTVHDPSYDAILSISAYYVKILKRDGEDLILRVPIHEIASLSYVQDDLQHLISCKIASDDRIDNFKLVVLLCSSKAAAEEICSLLRQTFELVYTELTMSFFDMSIQRGAGPHYSLRSYVSATSRPPLEEFLSRSQNAAPSTSQHERKASEGDLSISAKQMLQDYIELLKTKLTPEELQRFAAILREYREGISVHEFCSRLQKLYGLERKFLFPGLLPFIPEKDGDYFDSFLEKLGIPDSNGHNTERPYRRTVSEASSSTIGAAENGVYSHSIPSEMDEFDRMLNEICSDVDNLDSSIDTN